MSKFFTGDLGFGFHDAIKICKNLLNVRSHGLK